MKKKCLIIDQQYANTLGVDASVVLLPGLDYSPDWTITQEMYELLIPAIVSANKKIAKLFSDKVYVSKLGCRFDAAEHLHCMSGTLITFLLADRLFRINLLAGSINLNTLSLPKVDFNFSIQTSTAVFFGDLIRCDGLFNQWIINNLLPKNFQVGKVAAVPFASSSVQLISERSIFKKIVTMVFKKGGIRRIINSGINWFNEKLSYISRKLLSPFAINAIPHHLCHYEDAFKSGGFYWPRGPLFNLPDKMPEFDRSNSLYGSISRSDFLAHSEQISMIFREFLADCNQNVMVYDETFDAIATLVVNLQCETAVELAPQACDWALKKMTHFNTDVYVTGWPATGILPSLYTFAAKELNRKVVGMQHSAWGGYLARGALISEMLILGSDDYVTFGWGGVEKGLSSWNRRAVQLPSPLISSNALAFNKMTRTRILHRHVMLATGFLYRFPSVPDSALKVDVIDIWVGKLLSIVKELTKQNIRVTIAMYNKTIADTHRPIVDRLIAAGNGLCQEHTNHEKRIRNLLYSGEFYDDYDAVIWDVPAGGFTEALSAQVPTFALCDRDIITILPEGAEAIEMLEQQSLLFDSAEAIRDTLNIFYSNPEWATQTDRIAASNNFMYKFCRTSDSWESEWKSFFHTYL